METKSLIKKTSFGILLAGGLFILLNFGFFWENLKYTLVKPAIKKETLSQTAKPAPKGKPNTLIIESLGLKLPVLYVDDTAETTFQKALQKGVVHYPGTAKPGEYGNVYIFGHSSDNAWAKGEYKTAFALLPRIEKGAKLILTNWNGNVFQYIVTNTFVTSAKDTQLLDQNGYKKKQLTLQTSYPIGTSLQRYIVIGEIPEDTTPSQDPNAS